MSPSAPLHPCAEPHCPALVSTTRCPAHTGNPSHGWGNNNTRIRGRKLQTLRMELWDREPNCRQCKQLLLPSQMVRDHIIPMAEGGTDTDDNIQPLCHSCSDAKTHRESARGRGLGG